jgi:hypothetical protein
MGAPTYFATTFGMMTLSIVALKAYTECHVMMISVVSFGKKPFLLSAFMPSAVLPSVVATSKCSLYMFKELLTNKHLMITSIRTQLLKQFYSIVSGHKKIKKFKFQKITQAWLAC